MKKSARKSNHKETTKATKKAIFFVVFVSFVVFNKRRMCDFFTLSEGLNYDDLIRTRCSETAGWLAQ